MRVAVLGPVTLWDSGGKVVDVGARRQRGLLAVLAAAAGRTVSTDAVIDALWGDHSPHSAVSTLQSYISRLRRVLPDDVQLQWADVGYRLDIDPDEVDYLLFERLADRGRALLRSGDMGAARQALAEAEHLWRGAAFEEFADLDFANGLATRLEERRLVATEDRMRCELALGDSEAVISTLGELRLVHPLRERFHEMYALALYRSGRQAEALRALDEARRTLTEELGLEPGRELRDLEQRILNQDDSLDLATVAPTSSLPPAADRAAPTGGQVDGLVGREAELTQLLAALDESRHDARFVVIAGDPGIGKTYLADTIGEIAAQRGAHVVWGRSDESGAAPAMWPWLPPLRSLARLADPSGPLQELLAGDTTGPTRQADSAQFEQFEGVADLLKRAADTTPVVILLDDLQWADRASLALLSFLAGRLDRNVLLVCTMRRLEVGRRDDVTDALAAVARRPGSRRIGLRGLTESATTALLGQVSGHELPPEVAATIHTRAEGNPFYAIELTRLLDEQRVDVATEVPGTVADVIRRRLGALSPDTQELLGIGAVIGREIDVELLASAGDRPVHAVLDALDTALAHRVLVDSIDVPGQLRFSHALIREVLLDAQTSLSRARLHLRVADAIEQRGTGPDDLEILADHLYRATPAAPARRAADALERAAEVAVSRVAYAAAEDLLTKALSLRRAVGSSPADEEAELIVFRRLIEVARALRYFPGATSLGELDRAKRLAERCGRHDILSELLWFEFATYATAARVVESEPLAREYLELTSQSDDPEELARGIETYAVLCWGKGRIAEAVEQFDRALALLDGAPPPTTSLAAELRMIVRAFWAYNHAIHGDIPADEIFAAIEETVAGETDRFHVVSICGFAGSTSIALGRWDFVERFSRIGLDADPDGLFEFWYGQLQTHRALVMVRAGDIDAGLALFEEGRGHYTGVGGYSGIPLITSAMAENLIVHGRLDEADRYITSARADIDRLGERWSETPVTIVEALLMAARGDRDGARRRFDEARAIAAEQGAHAFNARVDAAQASVGL